MRVIAGSAKAVRLGPVPPGVRPVSDRAREGLFSSLGDRVVGARVLDLYAGSGTLGVEALSRGAGAAVFVDASAGAVRAVRDNLRRTGLGDRASVVRQDVLRFLRASPGPFELVLLDPPYATPVPEVEGILSEIAGQGLVAARGTVVLTRPIRNASLVIPVHWDPERRLEYGDSAVLVITTP